MTTGSTIATEPESSAAPVDLSVIIVSYNTRELLADCLASIREWTAGITYRIYVVDNASRDGSAQMVRERFPEVILEANADNVGFARANSQVFPRLNSRYTLLLNSDTELPPRSAVLASMVAYLDKHPDIGALGPKILSPDGSIQLHCARSFPTLWSSFCQLSTLAQRFPRNRLTGGYLMGYWDHESARDVDVLLGACMMVRREVIDSVGGLDGRFFLGGEDVDWCRRIKEGGWRVFYLPDIWIKHHGAASKAQLEVHESKETHIAYYKYFRKHHGFVYAMTVRVMTALLLAFWISFYALRYTAFPAGRDALRVAIKTRKDILVWCLRGK